MSIEIINSTLQTIASGGKLALGSINIHKCDGSVVYNGIDTINFRGNGIYQIMVKVDGISSTADQLLKVAIAYNGTTSSIASASAYADATDLTYTLVIPKMIKICGNPLAITLVNSGATSTFYQNLIIDIVRV